MKCLIEWNVLSPAGWEERFVRIRRANLLQSYDYARVLCPLNRQKARWGLIKIDGKEAGLVQILEAGLCGNLLHAVMLDRGPLWLPGFGTKEHSQAFFVAFNQEFPPRWGRRRRIIPETEILDCAGYKRLPVAGYQTIWLDLANNQEVLRSAFHKKWRNALNKAEKSGLDVVWDEKGETLSWLLTNYQSDRAKKGYDGPSPELLQQFAKIFVPQGRFIIGRAILDNVPIAAILLLCHGSAATYQIGWISDQGKKTAAHNFLLWQALCYLKAKGILDFDLGGINDDTAKGVRDFKQGMGGQKVICAGHYT